MRIVIWIANESHQCALSNKISKQFNVVGIVKETREINKKYTLKKVLDKIYEKVFLSEIDKAWMNMQHIMKKQYPDYPKIQTINVENINSDKVYNFTKDLKPDLIIVSGTRLVKEKLLSLVPTIGIINLHTGLSPYIKGGPNCTNWCIATNQFHLIGNTIMWIDLGIDTGNIISTKCVEFNGEEDLNQIHLKVMNEAHDLYIESIQFLEEGKKQNVAQKELASGKTYYSKEWGLKQKINLSKNLKNWKVEVIKSELIRNKEGIKQINLIV